MAVEMGKQLARRHFILGNITIFLAVEMGKQLARRHFIHHVFGENEFEDGNHFYRFLEHEPFIHWDGIQVALTKRTVHLTRIFEWFSVDFGQEKQVLKWIIGYLDATKAGLLSHISSDGGAVHIVYQNYDWSINC
nr:glutaredoxin-related protein [Tanacetum cinerariifolium]